MKKTTTRHPRPLKLAKESVRLLTTDQLHEIGGGNDRSLGCSFTACTTSSVLVCTKLV